MLTKVDVIVLGMGAMTIDALKERLAFVLDDMLEKKREIISHNIHTGSDWSHRLTIFYKESSYDGAPC